MIVRECDDVSALKNLRTTHPRFAHLRLIQQTIFARKTINSKVLSSREGELDLGPFTKDITHVVLLSVNITDLKDKDAQEMARGAFCDGYAQYVLCNALRSLRHVTNVTIKSPQLHDKDEQTPNGTAWMEFALRCIDDARLQLDTLTVDVTVLGRDGELVDGWNHNTIVDFPTFSMRSCKDLAYNVNRSECKGPNEESSAAISAGTTFMGLAKTCSSTLQSLVVADYGMILWPSKLELLEMPMLKYADIHDASLDWDSFGRWISACSSLSQLQLTRTTLWKGHETSTSLTDWKPVFDAIAGHASKMRLAFESVDILIEDHINVDLRMYTGNELDGTEYYRPQQLQNVVRYLAGASSWDSDF